MRRTACIRKPTTCVVLRILDCRHRCQAVSIDDAECTTHPDACNCGSGAVQKGNGFCNVEVREVAFPAHCNSPFWDCHVNMLVYDADCFLQNNNCACGWDGGDCCIPNMPVGQCDGDTTTADLCDCQDPDFDFPCNGACGVGPQKGDSMCDDSVRTSACAERSPCVFLSRCA